MNIKKLSTIMAIAVSGATGGVAIGSALSNTSYIDISGTSASYTMKLDSSNKVKTVDEQQYVITPTGYSLKCSSSGTDYDEGWLALDTNQSFETTDMVQGLEAIVFNGTSDDKLTLYWAIESSDGFIASNSTTLTSGTRYYFPYGNYFKLANEGSSSISILDVTVTYSCLKDEEPTSDGFTFALMEGGEAYMVSSYTGSATSVSIPSTHNSLPVIRVGTDAFEGCANLKSITIPSSITSLGIGAFRNCTKLNYAYFETSTGWSVEMNGQTVSVSDLALTYVAATQLTDTYVNYAWSRS